MNTLQKIDFRKNRGKMNVEQKTSALKTYLEFLDEEQFSHVVNEVLSELHKRESEQIKKKLLNYSMSLRGRIYPVD